MFKHELGNIKKDLQMLCSMGKQTCNSGG